MPYGQPVLCVCVKALGLCVCVFSICKLRRHGSVEPGKVHLLAQYPSRTKANLSGHEGVIIPRDSCSTTTATAN